MRLRSDVNPALAMPEPFSPLDRDRIASGLAAGCLVGREVEIFTETDSTNDLARRAAEAGAAEGLVFFAETQRAGRGRRGSAWVSPSGGGLWFSTLLRPRAARETWPRLTLLAVHAVIETAARVAGVVADWKWPNDVTVGTRKLAGILVETTPEFVVLGIGLNVRQRAGDFPEVLRGRAISVEMITGSAIEREALAAGILSALDRDYRGDWAGAGFASVREYCVERSALRPGCTVRVVVGGKTVDGRLLGFTPEAHLRIDCAGLEHEINEGLVE